MTTTLTTKKSCWRANIGIDEGLDGSFDAPIDLENANGGDIVLAIISDLILARTPFVASMIRVSSRFRDRKRNEMARCYYYRVGISSLVPSSAVSDG